uniref:Uncharacterized protein n=1 Tax=Meloidogyne enterolobii TaxID=390850 RepID=A0A6V7UHM0_MELEN|nr:unnamed protein product [Meloidogyne enterolobii]
MDGVLFSVPPHRLPYICRTYFLFLVNSYRKISLSSSISLNFPYSFNFLKC